MKDTYENQVQTPENYHAEAEVQASQLPPNFNRVAAQTAADRFEKSVNSHNEAFNKKWFGNMPPHHELGDNNE